MANKLMVVAHPDDESIFGGSQLILERGWKVVCVTNGDDVIRSAEFAKAMESVKAEYEIWSYPDNMVDEFPMELYEELKKLVYSKKFVKIVTHSLSGEYGHIQHKSLSSMMHHIVSKNLYVFSVAAPALPPDVFERKQQLLEVYLSQSDIIQSEELSRYISNRKSEVNAVQNHRRGTLGSPGRMSRTTLIHCGSW